MKNSRSANKETFKATGNWNAQSKELKSQFSQLTDEDLSLENGNENEMIKRVESRLNKNHDEVISLINSSHKKV